MTAAIIGMNTPSSGDKELGAYRARISEHLSKLNEIFARAAVGDFESSIEIPEDADDEIVSLYTGINIMLDVITRQLKDLHANVTRGEELNQAKSEFVALVSHQLRTPLTVIRWRAEKLQMSDLSGLSPHDRSGVDDIVDAADEMASLISIILDISRIEIGELHVHAQDLDIVALADETLRDIDLSAREKRITITRAYQSPRLVMAADRTLLKAILNNLFSNAIKYTPERGSVCISIKKNNHKIEIRVADSGYGIPEKGQPHIFDRLYRASNADKSGSKGSGLGLYIVKSILDKSGGAIRFETTEVKGTTFFIEFAESGMMDV